MKTLLAFLPVAPFLGFLLLALGGKKWSRRAVAIIGTGSVAIAALMTLALVAGFLFGPPGMNVCTVTWWQWFEAADMSVSITFHLDSLSLVFCFIITLIGFLIHLYSVGFMAGEEGYGRFFSYMNLFIGSMLLLVLADNLLLLYLGWEGVGLCSYLLIGFWYKVPANGYAARKAFIVTRIGDTALILGLILLFVNFGTFHIGDLMQRAGSDWAGGSAIALTTALLLLGGAVGKSAQLPLQTWLPDAMAGPSPVSALIHAATMVTAGVYLIARTHPLFGLAPAAMTVVAIIGAATLLIAGFSALAQHDLKRILAYSTISQIGYMFLALGVGAWSSGIFHFMIHAFFKALLFLAAGAVILALGQEHDIFKMGGLRKKMPVVFTTFLIGCASLSALPFITAGFFSKDPILYYAYASSGGGTALWLIALLGAFITALYSFRLIFIVFYGKMETSPVYRPGKLILFPLTVLAFFSITAGWIEWPEELAPLHWFSALMASSLPPAATSKDLPGFLLQWSGPLAALAGTCTAYMLYYRKTRLAEALRHNPVFAFFEAGFGFDRLYDRLFVKPLVWLAEADKNDFFDWLSKAIARAAQLANNFASTSQNGRLRWYLLTFVVGIVLILTFILL